MGRSFSFLFLLALFLLSAAAAFAQDDSSYVIQKALPRTGNYHDFEQGMNNLQPIDTGMHHFQGFDPGYLQNLASPATPTFQLVWDPFKTTGFDLGLHQWDLYRLTQENAALYNTQNPYVSVFYGQGAEDMQCIKATYSQNIKPYWNFSLHLSALNTNKTYYDPQVAQTTRTAANTWYRSPDMHYMLIASAVFNNFATQENGGLVADSFFYNAQPSQRTGLPVNLGANLLNTSAKQTFTEAFAGVKQYYRIGPETQLKVRDTDSTAISVLYPEYFFSHSIDYHSQKYNYADQYATAPFVSAFLNATETNDLSTAEEVSNKVAFGRAEFNNAVKVNKKVDSSALKKHPLYYELYLKYDYIKVSETSANLYYGGIYDNTSAGFELNRNGKTGFSATGEYFFEGYNKDDYRVDAHAHFPFLKKYLPVFNIDIKSQRAAPSYTENVFIGNHFGWYNAFNKSTFNSASAWFSDSAGLRLGIGYQSAANLIYYDSLAYPKQDPGTVSFVKAFISKEFVTGPVHYVVDVNYQKALTDGYYVRVPEWLVRSSFFFQHYLFKKAILVQAGFDLSYSSAYYVYSYMPEISKFYLQDNIKIGNYPVFDFWLAGKVKRFTFFGKFEHINQGLTGDNYFILPHYPLYPASYRFGVRWLFFN